MSILFSSATVGQVKSLAKRLQAVLPVEELGIVSIPLSRAQDIAARLLGHADFHAAQKYPRPKMRWPWQQEPLPMRMPQTRATPELLINQLFTLNMSWATPQEGDGSGGRTDSLIGRLVADDAGVVRFQIEQARSLNFSMIFAGCDFPSFIKKEDSEPKTFTEEERKDILALNAKSIATQDQASPRPQIAAPTPGITDADVQATLDNCNVQLVMKKDEDKQAPEVKPENTGEAHVIFKPEWRREMQTHYHTRSGGMLWNDKADSALEPAAVVERAEGDPAIHDPSHGLTVQTGQNGSGHAAITAGQLQAARETEAEAERLRQMDPKP